MLTQQLSFSPELETISVKLANIAAENPDFYSNEESSAKSVVFDSRSDIICTPLLSPESCAAIVNLARQSSKYSLHSGDGRFGAPEICIREVSPELENQLIKGIHRLVTPLTWTFWRIALMEFSPPFVIRYDSKDISGIPAHHDFQSDISLSIALNDDFEGGGLNFVRQQTMFPHKDIGSAIIFPGKVSHLHSALPISSGIRYVLTVWSKHKENVN